MLSNFIEITLRHGCSPVNLLPIFRKPFPKNTSVLTKSIWITQRVSLIASMSSLIGTSILLTRFPLNLAFIGTNGQFSASIFREIMTLSCQQVPLQTMWRLSFNYLISKADVFMSYSISDLSFNSMSVFVLSQ